VIDFISSQMRYIEGRFAGKPFEPLPWQQALLGCLFGWIDPATRLRRYREMMLYLPRKNGKSCLSAAILNYVLFCDGESGAQCLVAAADRDQATIVFRHANGMIARNEGLAGLCKVYASQRSIEYEGSYARVLTSEASSKHGFSAHLVIVDELHAQPNRDLVDVLTSSVSARTQPIVIYISTADYDRPSVCNTKLDYAIKVRDGIIDDNRFLPVLYMSGKDDDWTSEEVWAAANPGLGDIKSLEYMRQECAKAKAEPSYQATFRRLELNQVTPTSSVWLDMADWDKCVVPPVSDDDLRGVPCWGGLDLSASCDLTALVLCWPNLQCLGGRTLVRAWHWIPEDVALKKEKNDRVPYGDWERAGHVEFTPGNVTDYEYIRRLLRDTILQKYVLKDIGADPWNASQLLTQLQSQDGITVVSFRQGFYSMSSPTKALERLVVGGTLAVESNSLLRWEVSNTVVDMDAAGNIKPAKDKARQRIDGVVAMVMAIGRACVESEKPAESKSVYDNRGVIYI